MDGWIDEGAKPSSEGVVRGDKGCGRGGVDEREGRGRLDRNRGNESN